MALDTKIEFLKGVGPAKAQALNTELGIFTVADLLSPTLFDTKTAPKSSRLFKPLSTPTYTYN